MDRGGLKPTPHPKRCNFFHFHAFSGKFWQNAGLGTTLHAQLVGVKSYGKSWNLPVAVTFVRQLDTKYTDLKIYESKVERFTKCEKSAHDNIVSSGGSRIFLRGGANSQSGCANLFSWPKTAWKWKNLDPQAGGPPIDSPLVLSGKSLCHYQLYRCRLEFHGWLVLKRSRCTHAPSLKYPDFSFFLTLWGWKSTRY